MKTFLFLIRHARYEVVLASSIIAVSGLGLVGLLFLINKFLATGASQTMMPWTFFSVCALIIATRIWSGYLVNRMTGRSLLDLRMTLTRSILSVPLKKIEEIGSSRILPALTTDIARINVTLGAFPFFLRNIILVLCCLAYMAVLSLPSFLLVLGFLVLVVATYYVLAAPAIKHHRGARVEWDKLFGHFRSLTHGIKEFKQHSKKQGEFVATLVGPSEKAFYQHNLTGSTIQSTAMSVCQTMAFVAIGLLFFVLPRFVQVESEVLFSYTFIFIFMLGPIEGIINWLPQLQLADVSIDAISKLGLSLSGATEETATTDAKPLLTTKTWTSLEVRGVTHTYFREKENSRFTLGPIDLHVKRGELIFIVGGNGSGKTTLVKTLTGLYAPESGEIRFNGTSVTDTNRGQYRDLFSVVFADFYLLDNLLDVDAESAGKAQQYLATLQLNHKVQINDNRFSTTELSQGQRKRLALLVAYLEDRPIYVFDEWAADQDPHFKDVFYRQILPELKSRGKTILVVSHDDKYYDAADRIIKLEYGRAVETTISSEHVTARGAVT